MKINVIEALNRLNLFSGRLKNSLTPEGISEQTQERVLEKFVWKNKIFPQSKKTITWGKLILEGLKILANFILSLRRFDSRFYKTTKFNTRTSK